MMLAHLPGELLNTRGLLGQKTVRRIEKNNPGLGVRSFVLKPFENVSGNDARARRDAERIDVLLQPEQRRPILLEEDRAPRAAAERFQSHAPGAREAVV